MSEQVDTNLTPKRNVSKKAKQKSFLEAFSEHGNVLLAARAASVSRQIVYHWLEHDEDFSFAFNQAKEDARDTLRAEIYRRAYEGWDESVYQLGRYAGTVHKYSDTLLIFHAKALMSEYRDKQHVELTGKDNGPIEVVNTDRVTLEQKLDAIRAGMSLSEVRGENT